MGQSNQSEEARKDMDESPRIPHEDVLPQHRPGEDRLQETRTKVQEEYKDRPQVLALSDDMQERRREYSHDNPTISDNEYLHGSMRRDAELQFIAASEHRINSQDARDVPASSVPGFVNTLVDAPPQNLQSVGDDLASLVIGAGTQMTYGSAPGNQFLDIDDELQDKLHAHTK